MFEAWVGTNSELLFARDFAIRRSNGMACVYLAFPYWSQETYRHTFTKRTMDMNADVLIGAEPQEMLGVG